MQDLPGTVPRKTGGRATSDMTAPTTQKAPITTKAMLQLPYPAAEKKATRFAMRPPKQECRRKWYPERSNSCLGGIP